MRGSQSFPKTSITPREPVNLIVLFCHIVDLNWLMDPMGSWTLNVKSMKPQSESIFYFKKI